MHFWAPHSTGRDQEREGGVGENEGNGNMDDAKNEKPRGPLSPFPFGGGDEGALASSSPLSRRCHVGFGSVQTNKHKDDNNNQSAYLY